jgi:hypothetical protein
MSKYDKVENATFYDGFLYIIYAKEQTDETKMGCEMGCEKICIIPELVDFDDPAWTLKSIAEKYPSVSIVIYESWLNGDVYRYGNHKAGEWERVGEMIGFA